MVLIGRGQGRQCCLASLLWKCSLLLVWLCHPPFVSCQAQGPEDAQTKSSCAGCISEECVDNGQVCADTGSGTAASPELRTVSFFGQGFLKQNVSREFPPGPLGTTISFLFRLSGAPIQANEYQVLVHLTSAAGSLSLLVNHDSLIVSTDGVPIANNYAGTMASNEWHKISVHIGEFMSLSIDDHPRDFVDVTAVYTSAWFAGVVASHWPSGHSDLRTSPFHGCIHDLRINGNLLLDNAVLQPAIPGLQYAQAAPGAETHGIRHGCYASTLEDQGSRRDAVSFQAQGAYLEFAVPSNKVSVEFQFLATPEASGLLMYQQLSASGDSAVLLELVVSGRVRLCAKIAGTETQCVEEAVNQSSAAWRQVKVSSGAAKLNLVTDSGAWHLSFPTTPAPQALYLGGVDAGMYTAAKALRSDSSVASYDELRPSFNGALRRLRISKRATLMLYSATRRGGVSAGYRSTCAELPCPSSRHTCAPTSSGILRYACACADCSETSLTSPTTPAPPATSPQWLVARSTALRVSEGSSAAVQMTVTAARTGYQLTAGRLTGPFLPPSGTEVSIVVTTPPQNGHLELVGSGRVSGSLTLTSVLDGLLSYVHDGSETLSDRAVVNFVTAEQLVLLNATIQVVVEPVDDAPRFSNVQPLSMARGSRLLITSDLLSATDDDSEPEDIVFRADNAMASDAVPGHFKVRTSSGGAPTHFSQADIDRGHVLFIQSIPTPRHEFFMNLTVGNALLAQSSSARIRVVLNNATISLRVGSGRLRVEFNQTTVLTAANFSTSTTFDDQKPRPKVRLFVITPPRLGHFAFNGSKQWVRTLNFTAGQIENGRVAFVHTARGIEMNDSVRLGLAIHGSAYVQNTTFDVPIAVHLPFEPVQVSASVALQAPEVTEGGTTLFTKDTVQVRYNPESKRNGNMQITVEKVPKDGRLFVGSTGRVLKAGLKLLSMADFATIRYVHLDPQDTRATSHVLQLCVTPNRDTWPWDLLAPVASCGHRLHINVRLTNRQPQKINLNRIFVNEGSSVLVPSEVLLFEDWESPPGQLTFTVLQQPSVAFFYKLPTTSLPVLNFTQEDVNEGRVGFQHVLGQPLATSLSFKISDGSLSTQHAILIETRPVSIYLNSTGQRALAVSALHGTPLGSAPVSAAQLPVSASNPEHNEHIRLTVSKSPRHGVIECRDDQDNEYSDAAELRLADLQEGRCRYRLLSLSTRKTSDTLRMAARVGRTVRDNIRMNVTIQPRPDVSVTSVSTVYIATGSSVVLTTSDISVKTAPADFPSSQVSFIVRKIVPPTELRLTASGLSISRFSLHELSTGAVTYALGAAESVRPDGDGLFFDFFVTNEYRNTTVHRLHAAPYSDRMLLTTSTLDVTEGGSVNVTTSHVLVDGPPQHSITFLVTSPPRHGQLQSRSGSALSQFTLQQLQSGEVQFKHDDSETLTDRFNFTAQLRPSENLTLVPPYTEDVHGTLEIAVTPTNDNVPHAVMLQRRLVIVQHGQLVFNSSYLQYADADSAYNSSDLIYSLQVGPHYGALKNRNSDVTMTSSITSFTQRDINMYSIVYVHDGNSEPTDLLSFEVTDGTHAVNGALTIQVIALQLDFALRPVTLMEGATAMLTAALATEADSEHFLALSSNLQSLDTSLLLLRVVDGPRHGKLVDGDGAVQSSIRMSDVLHGTVRYVHDGSDTAQDSFTLQPVYLATSRPAITVHIQIEQIDDTPPEVTQGKHLLVEEGEQASITSSFLLAVDTEVAATDLVYTMTSSPSHGTVLVGNVSSKSFSQDDIDRNVVVYVHHEGERLHDHFLLELTDGHTAPISLRVGIMVIPTVIPLTQTTVKVQEGGETAITTDIIRIPHDFFSRRPVVIQLMELPQHGVLLGAGKTPLSLLSYMNLSSVYDLPLVYQHDGSDTLADGFSVQCSLGTRKSRVTTVPVAVAPVNDQRPRLHGNSSRRMAAWYDNAQPITAAALRYVDADTTPAGIVYTVKNFNAGNNNNGGGGGGGGSGTDNGRTVLTGTNTTVTRFTQEQIDNGDIAVLVPRPPHAGDRSQSLMIYTVSDGEAESGDVNILTINAALLILVVTSNTGLTVTAQQNVTLSAANLSIASNNPAEQYGIEYVVTASPRSSAHGYVTVDGSAARSFTGADLRAGRVQYQHDAGASWSPHDQLVLSARSTDAPIPLSISELIVSISIAHPTAENSSLAVNTALSVTEGGASIINASSLESGNLRALAAHQHGLPVGDVRVAFQLVQGTPQRGSVRLGDTLNDSLPVQQFSQNDVDDNAVWYVHDGSESLGDVLAMNVTVQKAQDMSVLMTIAEDLSVTVIPVNDHPVDVSAFEDYLVVTQALSKQLTKADFHLQDDDSVQEDIAIRVLLDAGDTSPFYVSGNPTAEFLKADIDGGDVAYRAGEELGNTTYTLQISDGTHDVRHTLLVEVVSQVLEVAAAASVSITQGAKSTTIAGTSLSINTDSPDEEVLFNVTSPPQYGSIHALGGNGIVDLFSLEELKGNAIQYRQTDMTRDMDSFTLTVFNRFQKMVSVTLLIQVTALVKIAAVPPAYSIEDNHISVSSMMDVSDLVGKASGQVEISILEAPKHGAILWKLGKARSRRAERQSIETFTSGDLDADQVVYVKNDNVPDGSYTDGFTAKLSAAGIQPATTRVEFSMDENVAPRTEATRQPVVTTTVVVDDETADDSSSDLLSQVIIPAAVGGFLLVMVVVVLVVLALRSQRRRQLKFNRSRRVPSADVPRTGNSPVMTSHSALASLRPHSRVTISEASTPTPPPPPLDEEEVYRLTPTILEGVANPPSEIIQVPTSVVADTDGDYMQISSTSTFAPRPPTAGGAGAESRRDRSFTLPKNFNASLHQRPHSYLVPPRGAQRSSSDKNLTNGDGIMAQSSHAAMAQKESAYAVSTLPRVAGSPPTIRTDRDHAGITQTSTSTTMAAAESLSTLNSRESLASSSIADYDRTYEKVFDKTSIHSSVSAVNKSGATALRKPEFWV